MISPAKLSLWMGSERGAFSAPPPPSVEQSLVSLNETCPASTPTRADSADSAHSYPISPPQTSPVSPPCSIEQPLTSLTETSAATAPTRADSANSATKAERLEAICKRIGVSLPKKSQQATDPSRDVSNGSPSSTSQTANNRSPSPELGAASPRSIRKSLLKTAAPYPTSLGTKVKHLCQRIKGERNAPQSPLSSPPISPVLPLPSREQPLVYLTETSAATTPTTPTQADSAAATHDHPNSPPQSSPSAEDEMPSNETNPHSTTTHADSAEPTHASPISPSQTSSTEDGMPSNITVEPIQDASHISKKDSRKRSFFQTEHSSSSTQGKSPKRHLPNPPPPPPPKRRHHRH